MTGCTAHDIEVHDYSQPPHNTPQSPRDGDAEGPCQAQSADRKPWCQHERTYELVVYSIGTHDWVRMYACTPCTATLRQRHATLGPGGTNGIARVRLAGLNDRFASHRASHHSGHPGRCGHHGQEKGC